jgi:LTXXQ motif family protein
MPKILTRYAIAGTLALLSMAPWAATIAQLPFPIPGLPPAPGGAMTEGSCPTTDALKSGLAITDAQTGAWDAYVGALKTNSKSLQGMRETMLSMQGKTSIQQLDAHVTAMENRLKALKDLKPTLSALYTSLSADQKSKADGMLLAMSCLM